MKARRKLLLAFACLVSMSFAPALSAQALIRQIRANGPTSAFINLVYLSEGYTAGQLPQFLADATNAMNRLLATAPWSVYSNYFNVFAISVASAQSGSDHYTPTVSLVDTYFNSTFDSYGTQRLLTIPPNDKDGDYSHGYGKVDALLQQWIPEYDIVGIIVNDAMYGGSGGQYFLVSINSASAEIALHEMGHSFAALGDEYSTANAGYPDIEEPNTTTNSTRETIKWNAWIQPNISVPTPDVAANYGVVGLFEGAHYHTTGWYRPKHDCKMRTLGVPFCEVCAQELVLSIYRAIRPVQRVSPASASVTIDDQGSASFSISILKPATYPLTVQWFTNGVAVSGATSTDFAINGGQLPHGTNEIKVLANDPSGFVRTDPASRLWETNSWTLSVVVPPTISNPKLSGTAFTLSVATQAGFKYVLEFRNSLNDPIWTPVQTNNGNGSLITLTNTGVIGTTRFYRVRAQ